MTALRDDPRAGLGDALVDFGALLGAGGLLAVGADPRAVLAGCSSLIEAARATGLAVRVLVVADVGRATDELALPADAIEALHPPAGDGAPAGREAAVAAIAAAARAVGAVALFGPRRGGPHGVLGDLVAEAAERLPHARVYAYGTGPDAGGGSPRSAGAGETYVAVPPARRDVTIPAAYFERLYETDRDPWGFATSAYERDKYRALFDALPRLHYRSALEVGCSIGVFTRDLAGRCDALVGVDVAEAALDEARRRCDGLPHVRLARVQVPGEWPAGDFDLIVLSEVAYYLDAPDLDRLVGRIRGALKPGGDLAMAHWLGPTDYPLGGDEAAEAVIRGLAGAAPVLTQRRTERYRLDVLRAGGAAA